jgi:hypothetical protein
LGGLAGVAIAMVASFALSRLMDVPYAFDISINLLSLLFSAAIGRDRHAVRLLPGPTRRADGSDRGVAARVTR